MQIYVSGSLAFDRIMTFPGKFADHILPDKIHILNVCFLVDGLEEKFGGTAGNIAYSLALLGESPLVLSSVGKDFDRYADWMRELGLSMDGLRTVDDNFTAGAYITTDKSDNQITGFNPGAMTVPCGFAFNGLNPAETIAVVSPGNLDDMMGHPRHYREQGVDYIFDPGQQIPAFSGDQLKEAINGCRLLITNDYELEMIMKSTGLDKAELLSMCGAIITTLGEEGSRVIEQGVVTDVPVCKVGEVRDPTGAGDAYRAGLIKGLAMGKGLAEAARLGAVCSAYCVEKKGTQEHRFTWDEFCARYQDTFGETP